MKTKIFYGWWITVIAFLNLFVWAGFGFYGFSVFVPSLQAEFGWGRGPINVCLTLFALIGALGSPVIGRLVDRTGAKKVMAVSTVFFGIGFVIAATTDSLIQLYIGYVIIGFASAGIGSIPSAKIISRWFIRHRGRAMGIMGAGIGAGGFVLAPLIGGYIIPAFGWQAAFMSMAVGTWLLIPVILTVVKSSPAEKGLRALGDEEAEGPAAAGKVAAGASGTAAGGPTAGSGTEPAVAGQAAAGIGVPAEVAGTTRQDEGLTLSQAYKTPAFWLIVFTYAVCNFSMAGAVMNMVPYFVDIGLDMKAAAGALSLVGLFSMVNKLVFGWLCDVMNAKFAAAVGLIIETAALALLITIDAGSSMWMLYLFAILIGTAAGQWLPTMAMITSQSFGTAHYGAIFGVITFFQLGGTALGPPFMGSMYDFFGNYRLAFTIGTVLAASCVIAVLLVRKPVAEERA
jgi:MFS family permease